MTLHKGPLEVVAEGHCSGGSEKQGRAQASRDATT